MKMKMNFAFNSAFVVQPPTPSLVSKHSIEYGNGKRKDNSIRNYNYDSDNDNDHRTPTTRIVIIITKYSFKAMTRFDDRLTIRTVLDEEAPDFLRDYFISNQTDILSFAIPPGTANENEN